MKRLALAIALACVLSGSVFAGDVHSTGAPAPGPCAPGETNSPPCATDDGNQGSGGLALLILDLLF
jgi:hypothetical protein